MQPIRPALGICYAPPPGVGETGPNKPFIDMMENVFGGVRISTDRDPRSRETEPDLRGRPWLTGVSMFDVHVSLTDEDDDHEP